MKTVIEMAREAGFVFGLTEPVIMVRYIPQDGFERFAELVRADERGRMCEQCKERSNEKSESNEANKSAVLGEGGQAG